MSFITSLQNFITETETDVEAVIANIKTGEAVVEKDLLAAQHWVASNAPAIANEIQQVLQLVEAFGVAGNPDVAIAIVAANTAVTALNAFANATNTGSNPAQAVVQGYIAVKQANAAVSSAKAVAASAPASSTAGT